MSDRHSSVHLELVRVRFQAVAPGKPLPPDSDTKLQDFLEYWRSLHRGQLLPRRRDIDPTRIVPLLPAIFLLDVEADDFRFSLVGEEMVDRYGSLKGRSIRDIMNEPELSQTLDEHWRCVHGRQPIFVVNSRRTVSAGDQQLFQRLLLPLTGDDDTVTTLAGIVAFRNYRD